VRSLDYDVLRFNQFSIVLLVALAALTRQPLLVALVAAVMLAGSSNPRLALFKNAYVKAVRPTLGIRPEVREEDPRPHNFAQGVGGSFLALATIAFLLGAPAAGWILSAVVVALALLNLTTGFCVGCFLYFQLKMLRFRLANV
jgi:hypothetical protein